MSADSITVQTVSGTIRLPVAGGTGVLRFLTVAEAKSVIRVKDAFTRHFSPFDLTSRVQPKDASHIPTMDEYYVFLDSHLLEWDEVSRKVITQAVDQFTQTKQIQTKFAQITFPKEIQLVLSDGGDESGAAYCRGENIVVLPINMRDSKRGTPSPWIDVLLHELFHIWSRNHIPIRNELYAKIGYQTIPDSLREKIQLPHQLKPQQITNPDAPDMDVYISLKSAKEPNGPKYSLVPVLYANRPFNASVSRSFFDYLQCKLMSIDLTNSESPVAAAPTFFGYEDVLGFYESVGRNTDYTIHPEEILADNFVIWLNGRGSHGRPIKTPQIPAYIGEAIEKAAAASATPTVATTPQEK